MNNSRWKEAALAVGKQALSKLHLLLWPIPLVVLLEFLNRGSVYKTFSFVKNGPNEFILNYGIILALFLFFVALIGRTQIAFWIMTLLVSIVGVISGVKFKMLGVPLLPWDIVLTAETADVTEQFQDLIPWKLIGGIVVFIIVCIVAFKYIKLLRGKFNWIERIVFALLTVAVLFVLYTDKPIKIKSAMDIYTIPWDQADNYLRNGFALTSMMNLDLVFIDEPENYSDKSIETLVNSVERRTNVNGSVKPNVIVVLGESLFDATKIPSVTFSEDPMPYLHALQKKFPHGNLMTPQFGGGTANVEFEVLSGNSMRFLPQGSLAYIQYVNHPTESLASILGRQGYSSASINPFHNWFFNSRNVYYNFGFQKFISEEFFEQENTGNYISDKAVTQKIIEQADSTDGPDMIFANTMENHAPYNKEKFGPSTIKVSGDFPQETKDMLESYAGGMRRLDNLLKDVTEHFEKKKEPTMVLFFGDHLPSLGDDYKVYKDTNYISDSDSSYDYWKKMYSTPYVIWNNFLPENPVELDVSPAFLGPYMLDMAQLPGTVYTDFLQNLMKKHPVIPPQSHFERLSINADELIPYNLLQYDAMFGNQFSYGDWKTSIASKDFKLGYEMKIDSVTFEQRNNNTYIVLKGDNLAPSGTIEVNGKALETEWDKTIGALVAPYPSDIKESKLDVRINVIDTKNTSIAVSAVKQVDAAVPASK